MILATHQPYFFPYLGYFSLISAVDTFVFFDNVQFNRRSWMTRNRILKPDLNDFQYIKAGIKKPEYNAMYPECLLNEDHSWKLKLLAQLEHYKKKAAYFEETIGFLKQLLEFDDVSLVNFNMRTTASIARMLSINTNFLRFTDIETKVGNELSGGYWGLEFCKVTGADTYVNAPDGEGFYPVEAFRKSGVSMGFIQHQLNPYSQGNKNFVPGLSIIDLLMFNGAEKTSEMVKEYTIKWM